MKQRIGNMLEKEAEKAILPGLNPDWIRHNFGRFWLGYLGYNFESLKDGKVLTKGELLEALDRAGEPFIPVPYEPREGWASEEEREAHFKTVATLKRINGVADRVFEV